MKDITLVLLWLAERVLDKIAPISGAIYSYDIHEHYPIGEHPPIDPLPR